MDKSKRVKLLSHKQVGISPFIFDPSSINYLSFGKLHIDYGIYVSKVLKPKSKI